MLEEEVEVMQHQQPLLLELAVTEAGVQEATLETEVLEQLTQVVAVADQLLVQRLAEMVVLALLSYPFQLLNIQAQLLVHLQ